MNRHLVTALAAVAFAASGAALACEYSAMDDGVALAPANASKVPVAVTCEGNGCAVKPDKLRVTSGKPVAKAVVVADKTPGSAPKTTALP